MPCQMLHLMTARYLRPEGDALFFIGNIAPDAVANRLDKDKSHFRDLTDRRPALEALAKKTSGDFAEGVLLHLYVDWRWDTTVLKEFIEAAGSDWFKPYRAELALLSGYVFNHAPWAREQLQQLVSVDPARYGETPFASAQEVEAFVRQTQRWHTQNDIGPSRAFPTERAETFAERVAVEYTQWRNAN